MKPLRRRARPKDAGDGKTPQLLSGASLHDGKRLICLPIRLLIVAEEEIVQGFLLHGVGNSPQFKVVAVTSEAIEAVQLARAHHVDVVLLNVMMPRMSGLAALELMRNELPCTKIISFSASATREAVAIGASAVLDQIRRPMSELPRVLSDVLHMSALERA